jgi:ribosomal protein S18 acetylase RimI-like enzyme
MKEQNIKIGENDIEQADIAVLNLLLKQLNPEALPVDLEKVQEVMNSGMILTLRDVSSGNILIGIGVLVPIKKLFAFCGSVEDIVVDESYRGRGLGREIMKGLLEKSRALGMKFVDLTSSPEREKANRLYQSIGFERRETNVYRLYIHIVD